MAVLTFQIDNQLLSRTNEVILSGGDSGSDTCEFTFSPEWDEYTVRTAVFWQEDKVESYSVLDSNNKCTIPAAAMRKKGYMWVGVFGVLGSSILTSTTCRIEIEEGAIEGDINLEPSDDIFLAIIARFEQVMQKADAMDAQYQNVLDKIAEQKAQLDYISTLDVTSMQEDLDTAKADILEIKQEISTITGTLRINNVSVDLSSDTEFTYEDARITEDMLCDVYFDTLCVDSASAAFVSAESFNGYIKFTSRYACKDILTCSIYCIA